MRLREQRFGFTLIELMVIIVVIGVLVALGGISISGWMANQRTKGTARSIAGLFSLARQEAVRVKENHIVFLNLDAGGTTLRNSAGDSVAALVVRDTDGDGEPDNDEYVASMPFDRTGSVSWGSTFALTGGSEVRAPNDDPATTFPLPGGFVCCSFTQPGGGAARWVSFLPGRRSRFHRERRSDRGQSSRGRRPDYLWRHRCHCRQHLDGRLRGDHDRCRGPERGCGGDSRPRLPADRGQWWGAQPAAARRHPAGDRRPEQRARVGALSTRSMSKPRATIGPCASRSVRPRPA